MAQSVTALHRITRLPLEPLDPFFEHYPLMKLGVKRSARHYARRLAPAAARLIDAEPAGDWVLSAPPLANIPAGANLISGYLAALLEQTAAATAGRLSRLDIRTRWSDGGAGKRIRGDYARMSREQRLEFRAADLGTLVPEPRFRGRKVLFVNDISVTGAQQRTMARYFEPLAPARVHWLYLVVVDEAIGRAQPELEYALNLSRAASFEDLVELLATEEVQPTGKCLMRIFSYPIEKLEILITRLDLGRRRRLLELARREGQVSAADFERKFELLRSLAPTEATRGDARCA